jgi:hypothetical protein
LSNFGRSPSSAALRCNKELDMFRKNLIKLTSFLLAKLREGTTNIYTLPYPGFVIDTRSSPLQARFELDVHNDRNFAAWSEKWRLLMFSQGMYGSPPLEETVGQPRSLARILQDVTMPAEATDAGQAGKVRRLRGALAA